MEEAYKHIKTISRTVGLEINTNKTKMMTQSCRPHAQPTYIDIEGDRIEVVKEFIYLGSIFQKEGEDCQEIKRRIHLANKTYFSLLPIFKCKDIHRATKTRLYKTMIRTVLCYGCESWTFNKKEELMVNAFERKILRRIWGPVQEENNIWRLRYNNELYKLYKEPAISIIIRLKRLEWAGHVQRMGMERIPKRILNNTIGGQRRVGKPRSRWIDAVGEDARRVLGIRNWRRTAQDRQDWRGLIQEAKARYRAVAP